MRYIKLGAGGVWEAAALDHGRLEWGNEADAHAYGIAGDWEGARRHYLEAGRLASTATGYVRELREFYTLSPDTLWVTFARGHLWWAFAEAEVVLRGAETASHGSAYRRTIGPWRSTDINGRPLAIAELSSALTKVGSYQRTICMVGAEAYLLRKINGEPDPVTAAAVSARDALRDAIIPVIQGLHQDDFELLVELLFTRLGWRRTSRLGGNMKDIDMMLELPATGTIASVQVKSAATQAVLDSCIRRFAEGSPAEHFYFVTHSGPAGLKTAPSMSAVRIWGAGEVADKCIATGTVDWLLDRV